MSAGAGKPSPATPLHPPARSPDQAPQQPPRQPPGQAPGQAPGIAPAGAPKGRPVKPRLAAGIFLLRRTGDGPDAFAVLMGRRSATARFMPNRWVVPGGRIDPEDSLPTGFPEPLPDAVAARFPTPRRALAAARTALREAWEETGLLIGAPDGASSGGASSGGASSGGASSGGASSGSASSGSAKSEGAAAPAWAAFAAAGLAPAFDAMRYVARAITPTFSPIRFDTRFFWAVDAPIAGAIVGNGELDDLGWVPLPEARRLPMPDVTEFMLSQVVARALDAAAEPPEPLLYRYLNRTVCITRDFPRRKPR